MLGRYCQQIFNIERIREKYGTKDTGGSNSPSPDLKL